jgi:Raf kinase inhibitor-like YbhB/YbcL family protein
MKITSSAFKNNEMIPSKYTCDDKDVNPSLHFSDVPEDTKSLCLIVHDHDAPGGDFVHWLLWNIEPSVAEITEAATIVSAIEGINDAGMVGWTGPCPPSGKHKYEFHLYALNEILDLPSDSSKTEVRGELGGKIIEEASLTGFYEKAKL